MPAPTVYKPLSTVEVEDGAQDQLTSRTLRAHRTKRLLFHLVAVAAVIYAAISGIRLLARSTKRFASGGCHGAQRNLSSLPSHYTLPSGDKIPAVALGTANSDEVGAAVKTALNAGYRHIDGAWFYQNEEEVGSAVKEAGVAREQLWITSKLWNTFHAPEDVEEALDDTLSKLGTEYLDLYLIHWPVAFKKNTTTVDEELTANPYPTWQKLEEMVEKGKVRNIGISNFNIARIQNLTANPLKIQPAVNQVELNFWNPQPELLKWSKDNGMLLEAYSPLGDTQVKETLSQPVVKEIADKLGITPAQAIISWHVQRGTIVLPKSATPSRIEENFQVFVLPDDLFDKLEEAATSHPPQRIVNPSEWWDLEWDIFEDYPQ